MYLDIYIVTCLLKDRNSGSKETVVTRELPINTLSRQRTRGATVELLDPTRGYIAAASSKLKAEWRIADRGRLEGRVRVGERVELTHMRRTEFQRLSGVGGAELKDRITGEVEDE
jgi:hypothetical protein